MPDIFINDGGTLRKMQKIFVNDGGTLRELTKVFTNDGGTLRQVFASGAVLVWTSTGAANSGIDEQLVINMDIDGFVNTVGGFGGFNLPYSSLSPNAEPADHVGWTVEVSIVGNDIDVTNQPLDTPLDLTINRAWLLNNNNLNSEGFITFNMTFDDGAGNVVTKPISIGIINGNPP